MSDRQVLPLEPAEMVTVMVALKKFIDGRLVERKRRSMMWSEAEEAQLQRAIGVRERITELRKHVPFAERGGR